jgi:hypothetical protein
VWSGGSSEVKSWQGEFSLGAFSQFTFFAFFCGYYEAVSLLTRPSSTVRTSSQMVCSSFCEWVT